MCGNPLGSTVAGILLMAATITQAGGALVTPAGATLSAQSVPPPGLQGYVFCGLGAPSGTYSTVPFGVSSSGNLASPVPYVTIDTTGDQFYTQSDSVEMYSTLTVNGSGGATGVAYQAVGSAGNSAVVARMTLGAGIPTTFRLGILADNAPQPQNDTIALAVAGQNSVFTPVAGNVAGPRNDFYFFDVSGAAPGDSLAITVTNGGSSGNFAYAALGGFTFDAVPEPGSCAFVLAAAPMLARRRKADSTN